MVFSKILKGLLLLLGGIFIVFQGMTFETEGAAISAIVLVLLTFVYLKWTDKKNKYFLWFLIIYTIAQVVSFGAWFGPDVYEGDVDYFYYLTNILFIIAYSVLSLKMLIQLNFKQVFSQLSVPIIILIILDVFCVSLVTATAVSTLSVYEYVLEYSYNAIVMVLLSIALINYMYRNDNKSMLLLLGSICIVFSEIIQLAYFYVFNDNILGFVYSFLLVVAFVFFYLQSQDDFTGPEPEYIEEQLEEA